MKNERQPRKMGGAVFPRKGLSGGMFRGIIEVAETSKALIENLNAGYNTSPSFCQVFLVTFLGMNKNVWIEIITALLDERQGCRLPFWELAAALFFSIRLYAPINVCTTVFCCPHFVTAPGFAALYRSFSRSSLRCFPAFSARTRSSGRSF